MVNKDKRLSDLENDAGGSGPDNVRVIVDWNDNDEITARYIVTFGLCDPIEYTEHEFRRKYPNWKPGQNPVVVNWE